MYLTTNNPTLEQCLDLYRKGQFLTKLGFAMQGEAIRALKERPYLWKGLRNSGLTWEKVCRETLGISRQEADRLMAATKVMDILISAPMGAVMPTAERQVRPLTKLTEEQQVEVWKEAVGKANGGVPTAKLIQTIIDKPKVDPRPVNPEDREKHDLNQEINRLPGLTEEEKEVMIPVEHRMDAEAYEGHIGRTGTCTAIRVEIERIWRVLRKGKETKESRDIAKWLVIYMFELYPGLQDQLYPEVR